MRVVLIDHASAKSLKLTYAPDSITISGVIDVPAASVVHLDEQPAVPEITKDSTVPEQSFEVAPPPTDAHEVTAATEERVFSRTVTFAELKASPGFADHSQMLVAVNMLTGSAEVYEGFSKSYRTKDARTAMLANHFTVLQVGIPVKSAASFDDCGVFVHSTKDAFEFDGQFTTVEPGGGRALYAQLSIGGPDNVIAAGTPFTVTYAWPDGTPIPGAEVWSDSTAGYINRKRAVTDAKGQATFTVVPLALDKGEAFRLKFGFRHFTGKADKLLTVS